MTTLTPEALRQIADVIRSAAYNSLASAFEHRADRLDAENSPSLEIAHQAHKKWKRKQGATKDSGGMKPDREAGFSEVMKTTEEVQAPQSAFTPATHSAAPVAGTVDVETHIYYLEKEIAVLLREEGYTSAADKALAIAAALEALDKRCRQKENWIHLASPAIGLAIVHLENNNVREALATLKRFNTECNVMMRRDGGEGGV